MYATLAHSVSLSLFLPLCIRTPLHLLTRTNTHTSIFANPALVQFRSSVSFARLVSQLNNLIVFCLFCQYSRYQLWPILQIAAGVIFHKPNLIPSSSYPLSKPSVGCSLPFGKSANLLAGNSVTAAECHEFLCQQCFLHSWCHSLQPIHTDASTHARWHLPIHTCPFTLAIPHLLGHLCLLFICLSIPAYTHMFIHNAMSWSEVHSFL